MVDWYKHDIPDWMDATEDLDAECYRAFHVIVQLIMVNEKPIRNNERGISGRCRQSLRTYRRVIKELVEKKLIAVESGRIQNLRASIELKKIDESRLRSGRGGKARAKSLKDNDAAQVPLQKNHAEKTREEKKREDSKNLDSRSPAPGGAARASRLPDDWKPGAEDIAEAKAKLGSNASREFQKFRDYWKAQPGQRGVKLDWDATWRNWVRKAEEDGHGKVNADNPRAGSLIAALDRRIAAAKIEEEPD